MKIGPMIIISAVVIVLAIIILSVSFALVGVFTRHFSQGPLIAPDLASSILSVLFGLVSLILIIRVAGESFLSQSWVSLSLSAIIAAMAALALAGKSSWATGLGLGLIGIAIIVCSAPWDKDESSEQE